MATILLSAAGAAIGGSVGGTLAGLSMAAVGRAAGATLGRAIDQRLMGSGSDVVETGRIDRFRLTSASEGTPVGRVFGRMRVSGQVIWATRFRENVSTSGGGGKGAPSKPKVREYSYSVSLAVALCEGEISRVGRVWADGVEVGRDGLNMRVYSGSQDQMPDAKIAAVEGSDHAPAYRGIAYVVFEDLELGPFGNRVPQFSFEVMRPTPAHIDGAEHEITRGIHAVALMPGTGEYALATTPVHFETTPGRYRSSNVNTVQGKTDLAVSVEALGEELPNCGSVSLIASWFGSDLRCAQCEIKPKVENRTLEGKDMPWEVSGLARSQADEIARVEDRPVYGGTPTDASIVEAVARLHETGQAVMFYPFILMGQLEGNGLTDPWSGSDDQPVLPWRGRVTLSMAPGQPGSPDQTVAAEAEVAAFFGQAAVSDFSIDGKSVVYSGPQEWSFRRFILHYAHLCAAAGGVEAFCIGSEMRGLTQIRGVGNGFPAVAALRALAADVREILGETCKISYAADWSEYFGYQPQDGSGDRFFHLDPLWADPNVDFIGIDNYMPLSDWREGDDHQDAGWGSVYNLDYLRANVAGGEGYEWFYHSPEALAAQIRTPISDEEHGEPWIWRYKDIRSWWEQPHHERVGGVRSALPTAWQPRSKPIWFTELGCAAVDLGTNQPNKFLDPKSSESSLPRFSKGIRDEFMQMQYLRAMLSYWRDPEHNPTDPETGIQMVDMDRAHVWAWDARPYPAFPNQSDLWSDGENYFHGHWINGRTASRPLSSVVAELCEAAGVKNYDVSELYGAVRGFAAPDIETARAMLQPLLLAHGADAVERDGVLQFRSRDGKAVTGLDPELLAVTGEQEETVQRSRASHAEVSGRVRIGFVEADRDYEARSAEAVFPDEGSVGVAHSEVPLAMTQGEGRRVAERWLAEARVARDTARFALPLSQAHLGAGDVVRLDSQDGPADYRIDHVEDAGVMIVEAARVDRQIYSPSRGEIDVGGMAAFVPPLPVFPVFMDLPLLTGDEVPHAPHLAVAADPWPGSVAVYGSAEDSDYGLMQILNRQSVVGTTLTGLAAAVAGLPDRGPALEIELVSGEVASVSDASLLRGANAAAIGTGADGDWEVFQFRDVEIVSPNVVRLSHRLRGQAGTDAVMPQNWPPGAVFVLLDGTPEQIVLASGNRDLARHYRIGPAQRPFDDPSYGHHVHAFTGVGLRPYAPVHLRAKRGTSGDLVIDWVRRTRIDGDAWTDHEVPLGEATEAYAVRVIKDGQVLREVTVGTAGWTYPGALQSADSATAPFAVEVAQISDRFGPGPFRRLMIHD